MKGTKTLRIFVFIFLVCVYHKELIRGLAWTIFIIDLFIEAKLGMKSEYVTQLKEFGFDLALQTSYLNPGIPLPSMSVGIMQASEFSPEAFRVLSQEYTIPVVVRDLFKDSVAVKKWHDMEYIKEKLGDVDCLAVEDISKAAQGFKSKTFLEVMKNITNGGTNSLANDFTFFQNKVNLIDDLELHRFGTIWNKPVDVDLVIPGVFMSGTRYGTPWHSAINSNIFIQVAGAKTWKFIHPEFSYLMHPKLHPPRPLAVWGQPNFRDARIYSTNFTTFYDWIPHYEVTIKAGDVLFNPHWWWHSIVNNPKYTENSDELDIGVPLRVMKHSADWAANWVFSSIINLGFKLPVPFALYFGLEILDLPPGKTLLPLSRNAYSSGGEHEKEREKFIKTDQK